MAQLSILWQNQTKVAVDTKVIENHLTDILRRLGQVGRVELEITLVGDRAITKLKDQFLGVKEATDVLSFPNGSDQSELLGSLVVSVETAHRQAKDAGVNLIDELKMLTGHGLLHLLGYHHQ